MRSLIVLAALFASGCATQTQVAPPVSVVVKVPTPVPCDVEPPQEPVWVFDNAQPAMALDAKVRLMRAELIQRAQFQREQAAALVACRSLPASSPPSPPSR